jgi:DNA-binding SARP family transcriptional activator
MKRSMTRTTPITKGIAMTREREAEVELRLLGGFGLRVDGRQLEVTPAAQRLLAFVALTPRGADRSFVAFQLWPEHTEQRARANLRSALWRLGKASARLIVATKGQLRLGPDVWVDARHGIDELAAGGVTSLADASLPFHALDSDLLPDWYDDWLVIERERLRQLRLASLEELARRDLAEGRPGRSIQLALAAVAIEPLRESGHRLVIEAHLAQGNQIDALRQFQHLRSLLHSALGCEPTPELSRLVSDAVPDSRPVDAVAPPTAPLLIAV